MGSAFKTDIPGNSKVNTTLVCEARLSTLAQAGEFLGTGRRFISPAKKFELDLHFRLDRRQIGKNTASEKRSVRPTALGSALLWVPLLGLAKRGGGAWQV